MFKRLLATTLLLFAGIAAANAPVYFTATVQGEVTTNPQGEVVDVRLDDVDWMGEAVVQGYRQKILAWRFQPVIEDGMPVGATGRVALNLVAVRDEASGTAQFAIERATFLDDPGNAVLNETQVQMRRPAYPDIAAYNGVGARVMLVARVDADGVPGDVAVEQLLLTGPNPGAHLKRLGREFDRVSLAAVGHWRFKGLKAGTLVRIPIRFRPEAVTPPQPGWERVSLVPQKSPRWLVEARSGREAIVELADNGQAPRSKLRLLTPLESGLGG